MGLLARAADPGIIDGDVDAAECRNGVSDPAINLVIVGNVDDERLDFDRGELRLQLESGGPEGGSGAVGDGEALDAVPGKGKGGCFANSCEDGE